MSPVTVIYSAAAGIGLIIGAWIIWVSGASSLAKRSGDKKGLKPKSDTDIPEAAALKQSIFKEVKEIVDSMEQCQEISDRLVNVVGREFQKRIDLRSQDLSKKYETIIEEKSKNEEIAWKRYDKVLSDKKNTEAVIHSIAEGLVVVDADGKVIMMNPAAEKLLGVSRQEKMGKPILENPKEEQLISMVKGSPKGEEREIELVSQQDETKKILRASSAVIENDHGQTVGMVSVLSDITKQKELDQLKERFVANVSHELRTPLVAIDKSISLILSKTTGEISSAQEQFLNIAQRNLQRLSLLVNDLLDLSKLEAGKMELRRERISVHKVINESVDALNNWAKTKSITIEKIIQEGLPEVNMDQNRIIQVLNNLIGNAIKFTPNEGKISIEARLHRENNAIEVCVADTGVGIAKEDLPRVFDKFYQAGERVPTDITGTGIGLTIAKEIAEMHGGKIWAESESNQGARFIFTLPLN